jgi:hypothetical protein
MPTPHRAALDRLPALLARWLPGQAHALEPGVAGADLILRAGGARFVLEVKGSDQIGGLAAAAARLASPQVDGAQPLLVVPYMGPTARAWAAARGLSWVDLSGNAVVHAGGLHVHVEGLPNGFASPGRPSHPFTPRSSRVPRLLLIDAARWWRQHELATAAGLPPGTVSKVVQRLEADALLVRDAAGAVRARDPDVLLDAWAQRARFDDNDVLRFHAVGRSGVDVLKRVADTLAATDLTWAATGLAAAWQYTAFADFRLTTLYVDRAPPDPAALGLRAVERGENVRLVVPRDAGALMGREQRGSWCAHPVQVYLDLLDQPERAREAAADLRAKRLRWGER